MQQLPFFFGNNQNNLYVHQREGKGCLVCSSTIVKDKIGGRGTYYCPKCQVLEH